jgi:hypothetical protein
LPRSRRADAGEGRSVAFAELTRSAIRHPHHPGNGVPYGQAHVSRRAVSSITRWMLEEVGEPYDIHLLSLSKATTASPTTWRSIRWARCRRSSRRHGHHRGRRDQPIWPTSFRVPAQRRPRRGVYLKWLPGPSCIEPAVADRAFPRKEEGAAPRGLRRLRDRDGRGGAAASGPH